MGIGMAMPPLGGPPGGGMPQMSGIVPSNAQSFGGVPGGPPSGAPMAPSTGQWAPRSNGMMGGPQAPISPEGFNAYKRLQSMPTVGANKGQVKAFNNAANQFRGQYGGYDPSGQMQRTRALRRYGG